MDPQSHPPPPPDLAAAIEAGFERTVKRYLTAWQGPAPPPPLQPASGFFVTASADTTQCPLCALSFPTHEALRSHVGMAHPNAYCAPQPMIPAPLAGMQHGFPQSWVPPTRAVDRSSPLFCAICEVQCETAAQLVSHEQGQKHRKKSEIHRQFMEKSKAFGREGVSQVGEGVWACLPCRVNLEGKTQVMQHLEATKHKRNREAMENLPRGKLAKSRKRSRTPGSEAQAAEAQAAGAAKAAAAALAAANVAADVARNVTGGPAGNLNGGVVGQGKMPMASGGMTNAGNAMDVGNGRVAGLSSALPATSAPSNLPALFTSAPFSIWSTPVIGKGVGGAGGSGSEGAQKAPTAPAGISLGAPLGGLDGRGRGDTEPVIKVPPKKQASGSGSKSRNIQLPTAKPATDFTCTVCSVVCNSMDSLNTHLASGKHKKKQLQQENGQASSASVLPANVNADASLYCKVCNVSCCGRDNFEAHLKGKPHAKRLRLNAAQAQGGGQGEGL